MSESVQAIPHLAPPREIPVQRRAVFITAREWIKHLSLFLLTCLTTTFAGIVISSPNVSVAPPALSGLFSYVLFVPDYYLRIVGEYVSFAIAHPIVLTQGLAFAVSLLTILTAHEMGHYLACRFYGVNATLPFFIPAPPLFLAGTFGAFIKMKSPIPSRRALFDIGLAGPIAGFVMLLPVALIGILTLEPAPQTTGLDLIFFNDPLLFRIMAKVTGGNLADAAPNPYYMAAWIGLLVTSLNLMPVGQLDGGHGTFAAFGARAHKLLGRMAFITMAAIALLGYLWHGSPSGFLYTVLLGIMLRVRHPSPQQMEPLGARRVVVGIITLIVFALSFVPFPITLT
jgi:membrane-associated protease RseP (regulator of RpoE activity)